METKKCRECQSDIPKKAKICAHCKTDQRTWLNRHPLIVTGGVIVLLTVIGLSKNNKVTEQKTEPVVAQDNVSRVPAQSVVKTDQQILEENLSSIISTPSPIDTVYRGIKVEKSDPDRPNGTKMITVTIDVSNVFNKDSLIRNSGRLSSQVFKSVFDSKLDTYDVFVWYRGETADRYGNKKMDTILTYGMDKPTFSKVNWQNFESSKLCSFLEQEERINGAGNGPSCTLLVNMQ